MGFGLHARFAHETPVEDAHPAILVLGRSPGLEGPGEWSNVADDGRAFG